ncbi:MAG TPA: VOC family protein [Gemmatimonadaceae bacterium]|nr:VOC family protein [Gemmatimonadaceae bacterium]
MFAAHGRFVWHDLVTSDVAAAQSFYTTITPWKTQLWEAGDVDYPMWVNGEEPIGGLTPVSADGHPHWRTYVCVYDADACARQAEKLGGTILAAPREVKDVGCYAVLADPMGAEFGLFEPDTQPPGHDGVPNIGEFSWHELITTDQKAAFEFYNQLFKWETLDEVDLGPQHGIYRIYGRSGRQLGGMMNRVEGMPQPNWVPYIRVADVNQRTEDAKRGGATVLVGPMDVPGGDRIVQCTDPQGATFALHTLKAT